MAQCKEKIEIFLESEVMLMKLYDEYKMIISAIFFRINGPKPLEMKTV